MKKLGKKAKVHENSLSAYCSSACTCLTITCTCSSTSHDPTGNYFQGDFNSVSNVSAQRWMVINCQKKKD